VNPEKIKSYLNESLTLNDGEKIGIQIVKYMDKRGELLPCPAESCNLMDGWLCSGNHCRLH
jgi:hypothetical protein